MKARCRWDGDGFSPTQSQTRRGYEIQLAINRKALWREYVEDVRKRKRTIAKGDGEVHARYATRAVRRYGSVREKGV